MTYGDRDKPIMANPSVWKNAKNLRLVEWADKHLSSLPKEQPVDHAAVVFPRRTRRRFLSLSLARARARVERVGLLLVPPVQLACLSDSRMRLALVSHWTVPAKAE